MATTLKEVRALAKKKDAVSLAEVRRLAAQGRSNKRMEELRKNPSRLFESKKDKDRALMSGAAQGFTLGFSDEIESAATGESLEDIRARLAQRREQFPGAFLTGEIAGGFVNPALGLVGRAATIPGRLAAGSALGAATGAGRSEASTPLGFAKDVGMGAAAGAGLNLPILRAVTGVGQGIGAGLRRLPFGVQTRLQGAGLGSLGSQILGFGPLPGMAGGFLAGRQIDKGVQKLLSFVEARAKPGSDSFIKATVKNTFKGIGAGAATSAALEAMSLIDTSSPIVDGLIVGAISGGVTALSKSGAGERIAASLAQRIRRAISRLPPEQRKAFGPLTGLKEGARAAVDIADVLPDITALQFLDKTLTQVQTLLRTRSQTKAGQIINRLRASAANSGAGALIDEINKLRKTDADFKSAWDQVMEQ